MKTSEHTSPAADACPRHVIVWLPDDRDPVGVVHIAHGMAEHSARYARLAQALTAAGWAVQAADHRGHGKTAARHGQKGLFAKEDGWKLALGDLGDMLRRARKHWPNGPVVLLGHSMGSLMSQQLIADHPRLADACVLSGSQGKPPPIAALGRIIARIERLRLGPTGTSKLIDMMTFQDFNKKFAPNRTGFDWLSRDDAEVDAYVDDPDCGFMCSIQLWIDLLDALPALSSDESRARTRKDLPLYIFSGDKDPVGDMGRSVTSLAEDYRRAGLTDVTLKLYPDARHETLNETNREEVTADLVGWLERLVG